MGTYIMHAKEHSPASKSNDTRSHCSCVALGNGELGGINEIFRALHGGQSLRHPLLYESLPRRAHHHGVPALGANIQTEQHRTRVPRSLSHTKPRVERDALPRAPYRFGVPGARCQLANYGGDGIISVLGVVVAGHLRHVAPRVHQDDGAITQFDDSPHHRIKPESRYVVHHRRADSESGSSHLRLVRIYRNWKLRPSLPHRNNYRTHPLDLFFRGNFGSAGPGGFPTDLDDVRAIGNQPSGMRHGVRGRKKITPVGEAVGGNVDDADYDRVIENDFIRAGAQPARLLHRAVLLARSGHAGATSGPPNRGGFAGFGCAGDDSFTAAGGSGGGVDRGASVSPRASCCTSSPVRVSRSRRAAATVCSSARFSVSVSLARAYASLITRVTSESTSCAVRSETSRLV